jgi:hypothetical protein
MCIYIQIYIYMYIYIYVYVYIHTNILYTYNRRVDTQNEFLSLLAIHNKSLQICLERHTGQWKAIEKCSPIILTSHSHYKKLISHLKKVIYTCREGLFIENMHVSRLFFDNIDHA